MADDLANTRGIEYSVLMTAKDANDKALMAYAEAGRLGDMLNASES